MSSEIGNVAGAHVHLGAHVPAAANAAANLMPLAAAPAHAGAAAEAAAAAAQAAADAALADDWDWGMTPEAVIQANAFVDTCFERYDAALRVVPDPIEEQRKRMQRKEELERLIPAEKERLFGSLWYEFNAHSWVYARMTGKVSYNWEYDQLAELILELERLG